MAFRLAQQSKYHFSLKRDIVGHTEYIRSVANHLKRSHAVDPTMDGFAVRTQQGTLPTTNAWSQIICIAKVKPLISLQIESHFAADLIPAKFRSC
jgi:hypothetical protein